MPIRGRYVNIALLVDAERAAPGSDARPGAEHVPGAARGARRPAGRGAGRRERHALGVEVRRCGERSCWQLAEPLAYFIPEHAIDPSRSRRGAALWAEVTLPPTGAPRPIRLGVKRGDAIEPIAP